MARRAMPISALKPSVRSDEAKPTNSQPSAPSTFIRARKEPVAVPVRTLAYSHCVKSLIRRMVPADLELETTRGVRIVTPLAAVHRVPGLGAAVRWAEWRLADHKLARDFAGFVIAVLRKRP